MSLDRRRFLTETGRLAAGAALGAAASGNRSLATRALAAPTAPRNESLTLGVIGTGGRGHFLMSQVFTHGGAVITAVCDVNEHNLARAAQTVKDAQGKEPAQVRDFRRLLEDDAIDALIVATPHHWHSPIAVRALEAGKHLYLEKPASHVFREGRLLLEAAQRHSRLVQHGTQMRSSAVTAKAGEVLASGILGEIKTAKAWGVEPRAHPQAVPDESPPEYLDWNLWLGPAPQRPFNRLRFQSWNSYRDYGNGEIGGDGVHDIDMACWGLGVSTHPVRITAHGSRVHVQGESDYPDNMLVAYQYEQDKVLIYENRNFAPYKMHGWDNGNIFYGTEGYMVFSRRGYFQTYLGANEEQGPGMRGGAGDERHVHNFLDAARGRAKPNTSAEIAHRSCALVHLGEIAYRLGRVLRFDPAKEAFVSDEEANRLLTKAYRAPWGLEGV